MQLSLQYSGGQIIIDTLYLRLYMQYRDGQIIVASLIQYTCSYTFNTVLIKLIMHESFNINTYLIQKVYLPDCPFLLHAVLLRVFCLVGS